MSDRIHGYLRRAYPHRGYGTATAYIANADGMNEPRRFFVHVSKMIEPDSTLLIPGAWITFKIGEPRSPNELATALEIEVLPKSGASKSQRVVNQAQSRLSESSEKGGTSC
jgi:hypothetical protein